MEAVPVRVSPARRYRPGHPKALVAVLAVAASASAVAAMVAYPTLLESGTACATRDQNMASNDASLLPGDSLLAAACWPYRCLVDKLHDN